MADFDKELRGMLDSSKDPSPERVAEMRQRLVDEIEAEKERAPKIESQARGGRSSRIPRRRLALAIGMAAALVAIALGALLIGNRDEAVAGTLQRLARVAGRQPPAAAPGPGEYLFTKIRSLLSESSFHWTVLSPQTRQSWISPDGSGRILTMRGDLVFPSEADRKAYRAEGSLGATPNASVDDRFKKGELQYRDITDLPADPSKLLRLIEKRKVDNATAGNLGSFTIVGELLHETYSRPEVRKALFEAAARIPGVKSLGAVRDPLGRRGLGIVYDGPGPRRSLIFDPKTSALLASTDQIPDKRIKGGKHPGLVNTYEAYLDAGVVDSIHAIP